jgi:hypothetical protein
MSTIINGTSSAITFPDSSVQNTSAIVSGYVPYANLPAGSVLQVVSANLTSGYVSTTSTSYVTTGLAASITPKSATSKILVMVTGAIYVSASQTTFYSIYRGGSSVSLFSQLSLAAGWCPTAGNYLDSPATTSSTTYTVYFKTSGGTGYFGGDAPLNNSITLLEIAA